MYCLLLGTSLVIPVKFSQTLPELWPKLYISLLEIYLEVQPIHSLAVNDIHFCVSCPQLAFPVRKVSVSIVTKLM